MKKLNSKPEYGQIVTLLRDDSQLLWFLTQSELQAYRKHRVLGILWWFLDPLALTLTYWLFITVLLRRVDTSFPFFVACALLPWRWFTNSTGMAMNSFLSRGMVCKNMGVRRIILPLSQVLVSTVHFLWALPVLFILMIAYGKPLTIHLLWLPLPLISCMALALGCGLILSVLQVYFRDTQNIWILIVRIWFYLSPGLYSPERVPDSLRWLYMLNPIAPVFTGIRAAVFYGRPPGTSSAIALGISILILIVGYIVFVRFEKDMILNV